MSHVREMSIISSLVMTVELVTYILVCLIITISINIAWDERIHVISRVSHFWKGIDFSDKNYALS